MIDEEFTITLGPDLLLGQTLQFRTDAFADLTTTTQPTNLNWWIAAVPSGPAIDSSLSSNSIVSGNNFVGRIDGSAIVAFLTDYRNRRVHVITALGAQVISSVEAYVVDAES